MTERQKHFTACMQQGIAYPVDNETLQPDPDEYGKAPAVWPPDKAEKKALVDVWYHRNKAIERKAAFRQKGLKFDIHKLTVENAAQIPETVRENRAPADGETRELAKELMNYVCRGSKTCERFDEDCEELGIKKGDRLVWFVSNDKITTEFIESVPEGMVDYGFRFISREYYLKAHKESTARFDIYIMRETVAQSTLQSSGSLSSDENREATNGLDDAATAAAETGPSSDANRAVLQQSQNTSGVQPSGVTVDDSARTSKIAGSNNPSDAAAASVNGPNSNRAAGSGIATGQSGIGEQGATNSISSAGTGIVSAEEHHRVLQQLEQLQSKYDARGEEIESLRQQLHQTQQALETKDSSSDSFRAEQAPPDGTKADGSTGGTTAISAVAGSDHSAPAASTNEHDSAGSVSLGAVSSTVSESTEQPNVLAGNADSPTPMEVETGGDSQSISSDIPLQATTTDSDRVSTRSMESTARTKRGRSAIRNGSKSSKEGVAPPTKRSSERLKRQKTEPMPASRSHTPAEAAAANEDGPLLKAYPPKDDTEEGMRRKVLVINVGEFLGDKKGKKILKQLLDRNCVGIASLQNERTEVFALQDPGENDDGSIDPLRVEKRVDELGLSEAFEILTREFIKSEFNTNNYTEPKQICIDLIEATIDGACQDPRISRDSHFFYVFSFILSPAGALKPHLLCFLYLNEGKPTTMFERRVPPIATANDYCELLRRRCPEGTCSDSVFEEIRRCLQDLPDTVMKISDYGNSCLPSEDFTVFNGPESVKPAYTAVAAAGEEHCSPASVEERALFFVVATPKNMEVRPYDKDTQYSGPVLTCGTNWAIFRTEGISKEARVLLMQDVARTAREAKFPGLSRHFPDGLDKKDKFSE